MSERELRLGVNIDHVATVRNARGGAYPDPLRAAKIAEAAGADGVTAHLREDRRHISDTDIEALMAELSLPLNFEMAATPEMQAIALRHGPHAVCIVPEKREERTTEGGLDVAGQQQRINEACARLADASVRVSLFVDPEARQLEAALATGAAAVEIHTGAYADAAAGAAQAAELQRIREFARDAAAAGLQVHAGHGLHLQNVAAVAMLEQIEELNIGHSIIARAMFVGLPAACAEMRQAMTLARRSLQTGR